VISATGVELSSVNSIRTKSQLHLHDQEMSDDLLYPFISFISIWSPVLAFNSPRLSYPELGVTLDRLQPVPAMISKSPFDLNAIPLSSRQLLIYGLYIFASISVTELTTVQVGDMLCLRPEFHRPASPFHDCILSITYGQAAFTN